MDIEKNRDTNNFQMQKRILGKNRVTNYSKIREKSIKRNKVAEYSEKKRIKSANKDIFEISFFDQRIKKL